MAKIKDFQSKNKTIIFVSHDTGSITRICSKTIWICNGKIGLIDTPQKAVNIYQAWIYEKINKLDDDKRSCEVKISNTNLESDLKIETLLRSKINPYTQKPYVAFGSSQRFGTGRAEVIQIRLFDKNKQDLNFIYPNEKLEFFVKLICYDCIKKPTIGIVILDKLRTEISAWNTNEFEIQPKTCYAGDIVTVKFSFSWPHLRPSSYSFDIAVADGSQSSHEMLDWIQTAKLIKAATVSEMFGLFKMADTKVEYEYDD